MKKRGWPRAEMGTGWDGPCGRLASPGPRGEARGQETRRAIPRGVCSCTLHGEQSELEKGVKGKHVTFLGAGAMARPLCLSLPTLCSSRALFFLGSHLAPSHSLWHLILAPFWSPAHGQRDLLGSPEGSPP